MFVRWQRRKNQYSNPEGEWMRHRPGWAHQADVHLAAILIEAVRIDGKPRQRHVAYLAGISEKKIEHIGARIGFWRAVDERLQGLSLTPKDRKRIEIALAAKVPRPTKAETKRSDREAAEAWERLTGG